VAPADAMHCQQQTARLITQDHGADYIFGLKGNQSGVLERAQCKLSPVFFPRKPTRLGTRGTANSCADASKPWNSAPRTSDSAVAGASPPSNASPSTSPCHQAQQLPVTEIAYYAGSRTKDELNDADMLGAIVGHWEAIENGTHRVRDVTMGEDACRVAHPKAARNTVTLRNLAIGLYNLLLFQKKTQAPSLPSWRRSMSHSQALKHVLL